MAVTQRRECTEFFAAGAVEVAVVLVTRDDIDDVRELLADLRRDTGSVRMRLIVADTGSSDGTLAMLSEHPDVRVLRVPGPEAEAARVGIAAAGDTEAVLLLRPDRRLDRWAIRRMLARLRSDARIGAVAPLMRDPDGTLTYSVHRTGWARRGGELLRRRWPLRSGVLSAAVRDAPAYAWGGQIAEADEGVILFAAHALRSLRGTRSRAGGPVELRLQRRLRADGWTVWLEPAAAATRRAGSGRESPVSPEHANG